MGISDILINSIMRKFDITEETVDKIKAMIDNVDIHTEDGVTVIEIDLKKVKVTIEKTEK